MSAAIVVAFPVLVGVCDYRALAPSSGVEDRSHRGRRLDLAQIGAALARGNCAILGLTTGPASPLLSVPSWAMGDSDERSY
jgi:hypothetical protein